MAELPLKIGEFTVIYTRLAGHVEHPLYAVPISSTDVKVYNIPPYFTTTLLRKFFVSFGPLVRLMYDKQNCYAYVSYRLKKSADTLITAPMTASYAFRLPKATFNQIVDDSKRPWIKNPESLKRESEAFLQQYFEEKLSKGEDSDKESDGWTVVRPKKRRLR